MSDIFDVDEYVGQNGANTSADQTLSGAGGTGEDPVFTPTQDSWMDGVGEDSAFMDPQDSWMNGAAEDTASMAPQNSWMNGAAEDTASMAPQNSWMNGAAENTASMAPQNSWMNGAAEASVPAMPQGFWTIGAAPNVDGTLQVANAAPSVAGVAQAPAHTHINWNAMLQLGQNAGINGAALETSNNFQPANLGLPLNAQSCHQVDAMLANHRTSGREAVGPEAQPNQLPSSLSAATNAAFDRCPTLNPSAPSQKTRNSSANVNAFVSIFAQNGNSVSLRQSPNMDIPESAPAALDRIAEQIPADQQALIAALYREFAAANPVLEGPAAVDGASDAVNPAPVSVSPNSGSATTGNTTPPLAGAQGQNGAQPAQGQKRAKKTSSQAQKDKKKPATKASASKKSRIACFNCKRRKTKCDEGQPSCSCCVKAGIECTYAGIVRKRGRAKKSILDDMKICHKEIAELAGKEEEPSYWQSLKEAQEKLAELKKELENSTGSEPAPSPAPESQEGEGKGKKKA